MDEPGGFFHHRFDKKLEKVPQIQTRHDVVAKPRHRRACFYSSRKEIENALFAAL